MRIKEWGAGTTTKRNKYLVHLGRVPGVQRGGRGIHRGLGANTGGLEGTRPAREVPGAYAEGAGV